MITWEKDKFLYYTNMQQISSVFIIPGQNMFGYPPMFRHPPPTNRFPPPPNFEHQGTGNQPHQAGQGPRGAMPGTGMGFSHSGYHGNVFGHAPGNERGREGGQQTTPPINYQQVGCSRLTGLF